MVHITIGEKHHNFTKKGSKSGLLKTFGPILGFTLETVPFLKNLKLLL